MERADKKIFGTLFFSLFATVTGVGIVVPLLPVYAHDLGASGLYIGLIFGAFSISRTFFLPYFGRSSDRNGRKPYIVIGLLCYALLSIAFAFSQSVESLIFIRFIQGIASAMTMPVIQAYVGDITPVDREGFTMGLFNLSVFAGLSIGPLIGGTLKDQIGLEASFFCMGGLAFIGFLLSLFLLPPAGKEPFRLEKRTPVAWNRLLKDRSIAGLFMFRFAYTVCIGVIWGFLPVLADVRFSLSSSSIGVLVMLGVLVSGVMQTPMGYLADRLNKRIMAAFGGVIIILAILLFILARGFWGLFAANITFGIGGGISMVPVMALAVQKGNRAGAMGSVMALMTMGHSLGMMTGALAAGLIMDISDITAAFALGGLIMGLGIFGFYHFTRPQPELSSSGSSP